MSLLHGYGYGLNRKPTPHPVSGDLTIFAEGASTAGRIDLSRISAGHPITLPVLEDHEDRPRDLSRDFAGQRVLLVFYLGGWSAPCLDALRALERRKTELARRNVAIIAVTADAVHRIAATRENADASFLIVHDHSSRFAQSLGLVLRPSSQARLDLRSRGIRLSAWTDGPSQNLTLAATLLLDENRSARPFLNRDTSGRRLDVDAAADAASVL